MPALFGCDRQDGQEEIPAACTQGSEVFVAALDDAPGEVRVDGVAISECLVPYPTAGDQQTVGAALVTAAQRLRDDRRALELGYLVGALRRGAGPPGSFHTELVHRVEQEAIPLAESAAFRRGEHAGRARG